MKKVDLETYNLIYFRKSDGRKFLGKLITKMDRKLIDSETGDILRITDYRLSKEYKPDIKTNRRNINRSVMFKCRMQRKRKKAA